MFVDSIGFWRWCPVIELYLSPPLKTETDPVSETSWLLSSNSLESGRWTKPENQLILMFVLFLITNKRQIRILVPYCPLQCRAYRSTLSADGFAIRQVQHRSTYYIDL
jgi:hypothetical protein